MSTFKGTIAKKPVVRDKVIFSAIKTDNADKPTQLVLFKDKIDNKFVELLASLNLGDQVTVAGKMQKNKLNNETEISIAEIYIGDIKPIKDKFEIDPETDFTVGHETEYGIIQLVEKAKSLPYYTDSEHYWYEGSNIKIPCNL
jgi:aspartyl/asparaginyl-tRNA synthetase